MAEKNKLNGRLRFFGFLGFVVTLGCFIFYFYKFKDGGFKGDTEAWSHFGDYIGGLLGSILSFFGFIALLFTISQQASELEQTRDELRRAAIAQESSEKALNEQVRTQEQIQFENTFFSLLEQHNKELDKISSESVKYTDNISELDAFLSKLANREVSLNGAKMDLERVNSIFGSYYRVLYQLLKFLAINCPGGKINSSFNEYEIRNAPIAKKEKMYSNIVRAFLGHSATQVLSINCYCSGVDDVYYKYKLLIERYSMLEHMPFRISRFDYSFTLLKTIDFYARSAFGDSDYLKGYRRYVELHERKSLFS